MRPIPISVAAAQCGLNADDIRQAINEERLMATGRGQGKVKASDVLKTFRLTTCPTCGALLPRGDASEE